MIGLGSPGEFTFSGFLIALGFGNIAHVVQRERALRIELIGLTEEIQGFAVVIVIQGRDAFNIQTRGAVLLARSDRATGELPAILRDRGARVREEVAYRTVVAMSGEVDSVREAVASGVPPVVVFASPSAVEGFVKRIGVVALGHIRPVAIGQTTARRIAELVDLVVTVARSPDVFALTSAVVAASRATEERVHVDAR